MFAKKTKPTTPQIRPLLLNELENVSGGASRGHISAMIVATQGHIS